MFQLSVKYHRQLTSSRSLQRFRQLPTPESPSEVHQRFMESRNHNVQTPDSPVLAANETQLWTDVNEEEFEGSHSDENVSDAIETHECQLQH